MKSLVRIVVWLAVAGAGLVGLVEAGLWIAAPVAKQVGFRITLDNQIPGLKEQVAFTIDNQSLRTWKSAVTAGREVRVLCLGGGATAALLQNDADTWWGYLGALLQKEFPESRITVSALFADGTGILQGAQWARSHIAELKPDLVIAMYGLDDVLLHPATYTYTPHRIDSLGPTGQDRGSVKSFLLEHSQICRRIVNARQKRGKAATWGPRSERNVLAKFLAQQRAQYASLPLKYEVIRSDGHDPLAEYLDGVRALAAAAKDHGAAFLMIGEPTLHSGLIGPAEELLLHHAFLTDSAQGAAGIVRLDSGWIELQLGRYFNEADTICQSLGVKFINPQRKVPVSANIFVDDTMLTDAGAAGMARLILPDAKLLLESRLRPPAAVGK